MMPVLWDALPEGFPTANYGRGRIHLLSKYSGFPRVEVADERSKEDPEGYDEIASFGTDAEALAVLRKILEAAEAFEPYKDGWYLISPSLSVAAFGHDREVGVYFITPDNPRLLPAPQLSDAQALLEGGDA